VTAAKKEDVELPFDDDEIAPLQEDDPRPQRVPQFPAGPRRAGARPPGQRGGTKDLELGTHLDAKEYSDPGFLPAFLYVEKGPGAGQLIPVKQGALIIGRASICDLRLQHPSISRRHAQITRHADRFTLKDLGSQNGTFVNRVKIIGDLEIRIGDEIALGNALLKLRGSGVPPEKTPEAPAAQAKNKSRKGLNLPRVAIAAAAVGSAAAALLTVAVLKFSDSSQDPSTTAAPTPSEEGILAVAAGGTELTAEADVPVKAVPSTEAELEYEPPPPASDEEFAAVAEDEPPRASKRFKAQEPVEAEEPVVKKSSGPRASSLKVSASRKEKAKSSRSSAQSAKEAERQEPPPQVAAIAAPSAAAAPSAPVVDRTDVIALYEKGDVDAALNLARTGNLTPLAAKISEYKSSLAAGNEALQQRETALAIRNLANALAVDQELSQGWAAHAGKLRRQLGRLYTQLGQDQLKGGAFDDARTSFETALKYDPNNTWARSELQDLGPARK
jgi:pSer/pThr/pTyr-binding forkhead associated (FHA) protein